MSVSKSLRMVTFFFIFFIFLSICFDIAKLRETKEVIKDVMDLSTKAAVLQVDTNKDNIADGIFLIDDVKAKQAFIDVMALNLNLDPLVVKNLMVDYHAVNAPGPYTNPLTNITYQIGKPTFVAAIKFSFSGIVIKKDITISNNFAGSVLVGK